jgi:hypothetical protein
VTRKSPASATTDPSTSPLAGPSLRSSTSITDRSTPAALMTAQEKAQLLATLMIAQEAENKQLKRQLAALQDGSHQPAAERTRPPASGDSDSSHPGQQPSAQQLLQMREQLETARAGLQAQTEELRLVQEDYLARKKCLREAAGEAARQTG